jgi:mono/diheme cytochrome c family protein
VKNIIRQISKMNIAGFILTGATALSFAFINIQQGKQEKWIAPATTSVVKNPVASNEQSIAAGKIIYTNICYDCHGKKGKGDGPKSADLDKNPQDFTKEDFQKQTDGALFWKITEGKKPMASYKKDLTEEQRWQVINYVRTLGIKK